MKQEKTKQFSGSPARDYQLENQRVNPTQQLTYRKKIFSYKDISPVYLQNSTTETSLFNLLVSPSLFGGVALDETTANLTKLVLPIKLLVPGSIFLMTMWGKVSAASITGVPNGVNATFDLFFYGLDNTTTIVSSLQSSTGITAGDYRDCRVLVYGRITEDNGSSWAASMSAEVTISGIASSYTNYQVTGIDLNTDALAFMVTAKWSVANTGNVFWFDNFFIEIA